MKCGTKGKYFWLEWANEAPDRDIPWLLTACPEIVLGQFVVNTSFDSGSLYINEDMLKKGWCKNGKLAISPKIESVQEIPHDMYDEWFAFREPNRFNPLVAYVNCCDFSLVDSPKELMLEPFWKQIEELQPENYFSEGRNLICITLHKEIFEKLSTTDSHA
jgi:hypothetical protein